MAAADARREEYGARRKALNRDFSSHVQSLLASAPAAAWEDDMRSYMAHLAHLNEEFADVVNAPPPSTPSPPLFAAPAPLAPPPPTLAPGGGSTLVPPPTVVGSVASGGFAGFGSTAPAFGGAWTPGAASLSPFGAPPASTPAEEEEDGEPERPPSPSVARSSAEEEGEAVTFEEKCKLFFLEGKEWGGRGVVTLQLRRKLAGAGSRLLARAETGKVALNATLYAGLKVVRKDDKTLCTTLFNLLPGAEGGKPSPAQTMLRFKSRSEADAFCAKVAEGTPK